jgi:NADPH:quinone reductase-like Zn-dependent oxidoreductase
MRVVRYDDYGPPESLYVTEIEPPAPGPGQILIRVAAAGVNPADGKWRSGMFRDFLPIPFPHVPGYEVAGIIEAVGEGVGSFSTGERVVTLLGNTTHGGYAEMVVADAAASTKIPDGLSFTVAAAIPVAGLTAAQMIEEHVKPARGETVLVTGAVGSVGRFIVHAALARGARVLAAVRRSHADEAREMGASDVIHMEGAEQTSSDFDHVADTVGGTAATALCTSLKSGGRICTAATDPIDPKGLPAVPEFVYLRQNGERLSQVVNEVAAGSIRVPIARRMPLESAAEAQRLVAMGGLRGKVILEPGLRA